MAMHCLSMSLYRLSPHVCAVVYIEKGKFSPTAPEPEKQINAPQRLKGHGSRSRLKITFKVKRIHFVYTSGQPRPPWPSPIKLRT